MQAFIQGFIDLCVTVLNALFFLFPSSPFDFVAEGQFAGYLAQINYFIPVYEFVAIGESWLVAVVGWYAYSIVARWLKAVE